MVKDTNSIYSNRPISPHLSIYRRQISSVLSIMHRTSGVVLFFSLLVLSWGIIFYSLSDCKGCIESLIHTILFKVFLVLLSGASFFHLSTGIRHLFWDIGLGFSIKVMNATGILAIFSSIILTLIFWLAIYAK